MDHHLLTHVGMKRGNNQDNLSSLLAANDQQFAKQGHLFLVADGMGGHLGGEKASEMASRIIPLTYTKLVGQVGATIQDSLSKAFAEANEAIHRKGHEGRDFFNMGTTCSCLIIRKDGAWVGHVGDSRVYLVRGRRIHQLTFDHSMVWQAAKDRGVDPDTVHDVMSNRILRCLGPERLVDTDIQGPYPVQPGDAFVLCSDGLSGFVADSEIATAAGCLPAELATRFLTTLANLRGGGDNITVVIVQVPGGLDSVNKEKLAQPALGGGKTNLNSAIWLSSAFFGGLSFLVFLPLYFIDFLKDFSQKGLIVSLPAFMISMIAGLAKLLIDNSSRLSGRNDDEAHVPISRARKWELTKVFLDNIKEQNQEIIKAAESTTTEDDIATIRNRNDRINADGAHSDLRAAFALSAGILVDLAPIVEKMIRYQQIPSTKLILVKPSI